MQMVHETPAHEPAVSFKCYWERIPSWQVLIVTPSRESNVINQIGRKFPGVEVWTPMYLASDRVRKVYAADLSARAFFPGYCFVEKRNVERLMARQKEIANLVGLLTFGAPAEVTAEEMRGMRALCSMPRVERITIPEVGRRYRLLVGKAEVEGVLEQAGRRFYVWVAGLMQGMRVQVDLKVDRLIPA